MNKYSTFLQLCAILFLLFLVYFLYKFIVSMIKKNRLSYYSLDLEKDKYSNNNIIFRMIYKFSKFLKSMVIFNGVSRTYDKYVDDKSNLKSGMDFISIKIIIGITFCFLYIFMCFLYKNDLSSILILTCFIIGFLIMDFYCIYLESKNNRLISNDILEAVIIMNNSYKANRSTEQAILDVIERTDGAVKKEFKKILNDIKLGLGVDEAFKRMYLRTHIKVVNDMAVVLSLVSKTGADKVVIFEEIEKRLLEDEKFLNEVNIVKKTNRLAVIVFSLLPLIFILYTIIFNEKYMNLLLREKGYIIMLVLSIIYILYVFIMAKVVRGDKYDR